VSADTYRRYLRAAKLKHADPEAILDVAEAELTPKQTAQLVSVLHDRHGYRLAKCRRDPLIDRLLEAELGPTRIADLLGCSPRTVARRQVAQVGSTDRLSMRCRPDKTEARDRFPILSFCAAGGGDDTRSILRVLRGGRA
jgi:hypothetical protein